MITKKSEQQLGAKENVSIPEGKLKGVLYDQIFNMKMEVKLGQLIKFYPQLRKILAKFFLRM